MRGKHATLGNCLTWFCRKFFRILILQVFIKCGNIFSYLFRSFSRRVRSPIDGKEMTGIESRRVSLKHSMDFVNGNLSVRCTEVFLDDEKDPATACREELDLSRLAENLALATCSVLRMHLYDYRDSGITRIGLRVCLGPDIVEYEVGSKGERFLPPALMDFDDKIMPLINECARLWGMRPRLEMELLFRVFPQ